MKNSIYLPQSYGQTEKISRASTQMLRKCVQHSKQHWNVLLPIVQYNNSIQKSTGYKAFFLAYGRIPTIPYILDPTEKENIIASTNDYVQKFGITMQEVIVHATNQKSSIETEKICYECNVGGLVLINSQSIEGLFDVRYFGRFPTVGKLSSVPYKLNLLQLMNCHNA